MFSDEINVIANSNWNKRTKGNSSCKKSRKILLLTLMD